MRPILMSDPHPPHTPFLAPSLATHLSRVHEVHHGLQLGVAYLHRQQDKWVLGGIVLQWTVHFIFFIFYNSANIVWCLQHARRKKIIDTSNKCLWGEGARWKGAPVTFNKWCTDRGKRVEKRDHTEEGTTAQGEILNIITYLIYVGLHLHYPLSHLKEVPEVGWTSRQDQLVCVHLTPVTAHQCHIQQVPLSSQHAECVHQRAVVIVPQDAVLCALHGGNKTATQLKTCKDTCSLTSSDDLNSLSHYGLPCYSTPVYRTIVVKIVLALMPKVKLQVELKKIHSYNPETCCLASCVFLYSAWQEMAAPCWDTSVHASVTHCIYKGVTMTFHAVSNVKRGDQSLTALQWFAVVGGQHTTDWDSKHECQCYTYINNMCIS